MTDENDWMIKLIDRLLLNTETDVNNESNYYAIREDIFGNKTLK